MTSVREWEWGYKTDADNVNYAYAVQFVATIFIIRTSSEKCAAVASKCIYKIQHELSNRYTCARHKTDVEREREGGRETVQQLIKPRTSICDLCPFSFFFFLLLLPSVCCFAINFNCRQKQISSIKQVYYIIKSKVTTFEYLIKLPKVKSSSFILLMTHGAYE